MRWRRWIDSRLHPDLLSSGVAARARFLVECLAIGFFVSLAFAAAYLVLGRFEAAGVTFAGSVGLGLCVVALRWVRSHVGVTWAAMLVCLFIFAMPAVGEPGLDPAVLAWVAIVPYVAALLLRPAHAVAAAVVSLVGLVVVMLLRGDAQPVAPDPWLSVWRVAALVVTIFIFGLRFAREQERALLELDAASRAKSAFLATMSHEIRTPMNGVLGITEVLLAGPLDVETREKLSLVRQSGHTLVALVNDLLDFSKIEAGKLKPEPSDFDLRLLVDDASGIHRATAKLKGVGLVVNFDPTLPAVVRGDALRLRQVLSNLVSNAVKFTERGEVRLGVEKVPGTERAGGDEAAVRTVRFVVADTGIGIAPAVLARLFTPFEQADGTTTRRFGGTGLGLALSQNLVRLMGGTISVDSLPGVGSRFSFDLPLEPGFLALAQQPIEESQPHHHTDLPVLVVDDNAINLRVACSLVEKAGYRTDTAENGQQALEKVLANPYLLVLMDCHMPVMDGFEATERIRGLDSDAAMLPIVALTASAMPEELEACKRAGMNDCLTKPVGLQTLKALLHRVEHYRGIVEGAA